MAGSNPEDDVLSETEELQGQAALRLLEKRGFELAIRPASPTPEEANTFRWMEQINITVARRLFFRTRLGRFGLGPSVALPDDVIATVCGSSWPLILRPLGDNTYKFVGLCYVEGLMYGESLETPEARRNGITTPLRIV